MAAPWSSRSRLARLAWLVLAVNLAVIEWGAYVRATSSGAGCGAHWPLCNGEIVPRAARVATLIEFSHRASSGVALLLVVVLAIAATRAASPARRAAWVAVAFMFAEALIGAGLVLFRLVEHDATLARAFSMALHLTNTFLLLAALTVTAWRASGGAPVRLGIGRASGATTTAALGAALVTAVSGAVAALGDTLFPAKSLAAGMVEDLSPTAHVFVRLRVLHPVIAIVGAVLVLTAAATARAAAATAAGLANRRAARALSFVLAGLVVAQVAIGVANVVLLAPVAMQLTHLAVADSIWIALVLLVAASSDAPALAAPQRIAAAPSAPLST